MINYIKVILFVLFSINIANANQLLLEGDWNNEVYLAKDGLPYSVFTINLKIDKDNKVIGELCSISHYSKKIDCPINFSSRLIENKILFNFNSNFGGLNGQALIQFSNCDLNWELIRSPDGESYFPKKTLLFPDKIIINNLINGCSKDSNNHVILYKSYLFNMPSESDKTKMYLIKGDKVKLLQYSNSFYQIEYITNKNKTIHKWLHCSAIDAC
ncbi:hypothetical protein RHO14_10470 [Orbus wheelerorum]|uniref:hypothetical protein n=1 Tax=Orbus wheelerorum TaxID=3074111 RepID=UPI00370D54D0